MPATSRKMVAILMTFGQITPTMDIDPFYEQSLFGFAQVTKCYILVSMNILGKL